MFLFFEIDSFVTRLVAVANRTLFSHSPPSSAEVKHAWSYTSTAPSSWRGA